MTSVDSVLPKFDIDKVSKEAIRILRQESKLFKGNTWAIQEIFRETDNVDRSTIVNLCKITREILAFGLLSLEPRSCNNNGRLTADKNVNESVGGHTNLLSAIMRRAITLGWSSAINDFIEEYRWAEITEAISLHDLPEIVIGDIPDNGARDEDAKSRKEQEFWQDFRKYSTYNEYHFQDNVQKLLDEMRDKSTTIGRMTYVADKVSAPIAKLCYDIKGIPSGMSIDDDKASKFDLEAMLHCDYRDNGFRKYSEMWTYGYFVNRRTIEYDDTGFFTAILVIATLIVNGKWYNWREKQYTHS